MATKINLASQATGNLPAANLPKASANSVLVGSGAAGSGAAYVEIALGTNLSMSGTTLNATGGGGSGTVTTTGSPASGNLSAFSGATSITNTDLTGDVTTSGGVATTIAANAVTTSKINNAAVTLAKIANAAASSKLLGSGASGSGAAYSELTLGTNLSMSGTTLNATAASTGFPFTVIQTGTFVSSSSSFTYTFPNALQSSGATAFLVFIVDETAAFTTPSGWTKDLDVSNGTLSGTSNRLVLIHKASASDTTVVISPVSGSVVGHFFEFSGTRALDQSSSGNSGTTNGTTISFPSITPTAGSAVYAIGGTASNSTNTGIPWGPVGNWSNISLNFANVITNCRALIGFQYLGQGAGVSLRPPQANLQSMSQFSTTGNVWATFSIS